MPFQAVQIFQNQANVMLHQKIFDLGGFTLDHAGVMLVSDQFHGTTGLHEGLLRHHGQPVRAPQRPEWRPEPDFLDWHGREVFKGTALPQDTIAGPDACGRQG